MSNKRKHQSKVHKSHQQTEAKVDELYRQFGQSKVERNFLTSQGARSLRPDQCREMLSWIQVVSATVWRNFTEMSTKGYASYRNGIYQRLV